MKINREMKIFEVVADAKALTSEIQQSVQQLNDLRNLMRFALKDVEQQVAMAQYAFGEAEIIASDPDDDVDAINAEVLHWSEFENNDQVIDETDQ